MKKKKSFSLTSQLRQDRRLAHGLLPLEAERRLGRVQGPQGRAVGVEGGVVVVDKGLRGREIFGVFFLFFSRLLRS